MSGRMKWWIVGGAGLAILCGVVGFALGQAYGDGDKLALGSLGEWVSGLGGFLAVGVSVWFGVTEHRRAVDADERARLSEGRELAAAVARERNEKISRARRVWVQARASSFSSGLCQCGIELRNDGDSPVYEVSIWVQHPDGRRSRAKRFSAIAARSEERGLSFEVETADIKEGGMFEAHARFADEDGAVWRRFGDGRVVEGD